MKLKISKRNRVSFLYYILVRLWIKLILMRSIYENLESLERVLLEYVISFHDGRKNWGKKNDKDYVMDER